MKLNTTNDRVTKRVCFDMVVQDMEQVRRDMDAAFASGARYINFIPDDECYYEDVGFLSGEQWRYYYKHYEPERIQRIFKWVWDKMHSEHPDPYNGLPQEKAK